MLEDTNNAVGDTQNSLDTVQAKLEKLLKSSGNGYIILGWFDRSPYSRA